MKLKKDRIDRFGYSPDDVTIVKKSEKVDKVEPTPDIKVIPDPQEVRYEESK